MARWRTLNKRASRRRKRDATFMRNRDKLVADALAAVTEDLIRKAFADFSKALLRSAEAIHMAVIEAAKEMSGSWQSLDPKYAGLRPQIDQWPEVIYEDILDAETIGED